MRFPQSTLNAYINTEMFLCDNEDDDRANARYNALVSACKYLNYVMTERQEKDWFPYFLSLYIEDVNYVLRAEDELHFQEYWSLLQDMLSVFRKYVS